MVKTEKQLSRLHDLLDVAENIPSAKLDQVAYKTKTACGTKLCLFGAYITRFRRRGFVFVEDDDTLGHYHVGLAVNTSMRTHHTRLAHFGIEMWEDNFLFGRQGGSGHKAKRKLIAGLKRIIAGKNLVDNG
jgi:hypothetical protein